MALPIEVGAAGGPTYPHLLQPGRIGTMALRNRITMSPMGDDLCNPDGTVSQAQLAYAEERARGGVALVMLGSVAVAHPAGTSNKCQTGISDDRYVPGLRRLADAVHAHGACIGLQLTHAGKQGMNDAAVGRPLWVPSAPTGGRADPLFGQVTPDEAGKMTELLSRPTYALEYHEMTHDDIAVAVDWFASAAARAEEAGIDGVELHAGHGYLIDAFLSPTSNHREDEYGGPVEQRTRFLVECLEAIRARVGRAYPVWCRLNAHEFLIDGTTVEDAITTAKMAEAAGADAVHISTYADAGRAIGFSLAHTTHFPGSFVPYARRVKEHVSIPVIAVGRIEPADADRWIGEGAFDFVAMGRKLLADPELPAKLAQGRTEDVRPCMYHYRCISQVFIREGVRCAMNPALGRERELRLEPAEHPQRVLVVGGGPAGMEVARLATLRGHHVVLAEGSAQLGGKLALASKTYAPNADVLRWLTGQIEKLDVDVRLGSPVDAAALAGFDVDVVVAAVGGAWRRPDIEGVDAPNVFTVEDLRPWLLGGEPLHGERVVVIGGGRAGMGLADLASQQGHAVTVLEASGVFASQVGLPGRWRLIHDLTERGVDLRANVTVQAIDDGAVLVTTGDGAVAEVGADVVLVASRVDDRRDVVDGLRVGGLPVHAIGDATGAGYIEGAMLDAAELAVGL